MRTIVASPIPSLAHVDRASATTLIRRTWAAVRAGRSRFNVAANERIWTGVTAP